MNWYLEVKILSIRQTVFFLPVDPRDESHRVPERMDFSVPRLARYMHSAWKRHQDAVFWVDIDLAITEGLTICQTRSNAIILQGTLPAHYISKVERLKMAKCCMKGDICLLDHHQKSHYDTITIGPKGMINRVLQLNNSQLESSFNSLLEKQLMLNLPSQPNPNPTQLWIERRNLGSKKTRLVHERLLVSACKKNLILLIERGNL